jgi:hypothetical protein
MVAASAVSGALANRKKTTTQTTTPTMAPEYGPIQAALIQNIMSRLNQPSALPRGYEGSQARNINSTFNLAGQNLANRMTARGLGSSPVAAAGAATMESGRAGQMATMQASLPLLERQLRDQDLAAGQSLMAFGRGGTTTGTTPSDMVAGGFTSGADMLAYLYGKGAFNKPAKTGKVPTIQPFTLPNLSGF